MNPPQCPEARHYEAYDWCKLSDNICIRNTGNEDFDVECEYYNEFLEEVASERHRKARQIKDKWRRDRERDTTREQTLDEIRLNKKEGK